MKRWLETTALAICMAASLAGVVVAVWIIASGMPQREGIDAIFLLLVALTFAVFFGVVSAQAIRRLEWKPFARRKQKTEVERDRTANA